MLNLSLLFGKSPFSSLQHHFSLITASMKMLSQAVALYCAHQPIPETLLQELEKHHRTTDAFKRTLPYQIPKTMLMGVERREVLDLIGIQQRIATQIVRLAHFIALLPSKFPAEFHLQLSNYLMLAEQAFHTTQKVIVDLSPLKESSFGGIEAKKVMEMIEKAAEIHLHIQSLQFQLHRWMHGHATLFSLDAFPLTIELIDAVSILSHHCESLTEQISFLLELS